MLSDTPINLDRILLQWDTETSQYVARVFFYMRDFATGAGIDAKNPVMIVNNWTGQWYNVWKDHD